MLKKHVLLQWEAAVEPAKMVSGPAYTGKSERENLQVFTEHYGLSPFSGILLHDLAVLLMCNILFMNQPSTRHTLR